MSCSHPDMTTCYSHCPRCGGEAFTGGFAHIGGCTWPITPQHYRSMVSVDWETANMLQKLDAVIGLLERILRILDGEVKP